MNKELIFVHDRIGPRGPIHNHKVPDIYDLAKRIPFASTERNWCTDEIDPLVMDLKMHTRCRVVSSYDLESLKGKLFLYEMQLSQKTNFTSVSLANSIGFFDSAPVSQEVLSAIRLNQGYVLLTCILESFLEDDIFFKIYNYFKEHNIPLYRVIYLTNCANAEEIYLDFCKRNNLEPEIKCEYIGLYLLNQRGILNDKGFEKRIIPNQRLVKKEKLFLNFNRRSRQHRYKFLLNMQKENLLDKCSISFLKEHQDVTHWLHDMREFSNIFSIGMTDTMLLDLYKKLPLTLDTDNFNRFPMEDELFSTAKLYDNTYISIVSETNFENNIIHMTEKTIKPIVFKHPFIIIGPAGTLKKLKEIGMRTFSNFWDESYDDELDDKIRMEKIVNLCKEIAAWPSHRLVEFYLKSAEIVNYNFNQFQLDQKIELNRFIEKYGANYE